MRADRTSMLELELAQITRKCWSDFYSGWSREDLDHLFEAEHLGRLYLTEVERNSATERWRFISKEYINVPGVSKQRTLDR
jgi:hypothetical protein